MLKIKENGLIEFDEKKVVGTYTNVIEVTEEDVDNIIVTALEGGIGYWARLHRAKEFMESKPENVANSQWTTHWLLSGKSLPISDAEEDEPEKFDLTLESLINGIKLNKKERPFDSDLDNMDGTTADCIIQYALFGKIVFG